MNKSKEKKAEISLIDELRQIRDKINMEIKDLTKEQLKQYWKSKSTLHKHSFWQNIG
ncbi:MAG: hypothetical protein R2771_15375 [Saprospiraceae bacterium]